INTFTVLPEYLRNKETDSGTVFDYRDWHIQLGRRFRSLKLWFVIRHYGVEGLRYHIRQHIKLAQEFATWVKEDPDFELASPTPLNLVCFRHIAGDETNQQILEQINLSGKAYLSHTKLNDRYTLRLCVGQTNTKAHHVSQAWNLIKQKAAHLATI
ncbi:MAG: pyridoxal-dependent decarboxylase, partial [Anaerolineales bacterium]